MAAQEYFQSHPDQNYERPAVVSPVVSRYNSTHQSPPGGAATKPSKIYTDPSSQSDLAYKPYAYSSPIDYHPSQSTLDSPSVGGGRLHDPEQYADNIPLRPHGKPSQDDYLAHNTQYQGSQSPESQRPPKQEPQRSRYTGKKRKGWLKGPIPWVVYFASAVQIAVFIGEIIKNSTTTGSPIMIHPQFNPMIGPSTYVLINMGARFVPCMRSTPGVQDAAEPVNWPCPSTTTSDPNADSNKCDLSQLCGFGGVNEKNPNQWFRFIIPMFLHAGIVHIGFNLLLQLTMGREVEMLIGSLRFALVYFSSGIFGFVLGGNFAASAIASTGASGCLFGILALTLLDLIYSWGERKSPGRDLLFLLLDIVISFVLGLLPGLDNFSHIGGFLMGLVLGICILHSPNALRERIGLSSTYTPMGGVPTASNTEGGVGAFAKKPVGFFKGRKPLWWVWWVIRAGALLGILVAFIVLLNNFYKYRDTCSWCKYLSCLVNLDLLLCLEGTVG
ncbi:MAG: hypothetical protein Q9160_000636 [Pyrenula sp. 1 TL-2023]